MPISLVVKLEIDFVKIPSETKSDNKGQEPPEDSDFLRL